ncbi:tRNA (N6-threonylcarbamoyladenosine(37)-N6)-methyltransferase TrmO [Maricurvus nonylphenolicus]|uniref:tRNA (N6-threonylcarbamoyladenosine(37)-N6)-methyltransferase TrmO n=1 Tax=Maricurvus nonylphenolicus TaxID=1008307 RepID=UPI0036F3C0EA
MAEEYRFKPVGIIQSPYKEKFAVPRQPGLVTAAEASLILSGDCNREEILRGIEDFSHLWLTFVFHKVADQGWKPTVRPPRLGGNQRLGVFATRSPFRPNPIGLSVVKLEGVTKKGNQWQLELSGIDLVDGTPILDIKPYIPYADALPEAQGGFADSAPGTPIPVTFSNKAQAQIAENSQTYPSLQQLISQIISQQPQPAYQKAGAEPRRYGMALYDFNIEWINSGNDFHVINIEKVLK